MESRWLKCRVRDGQFPNEYAVAVATTGGETVSMFTTREFVRPEENLLKVDVLEQSQSDALIFLPARPFEVSSRTILVPMSGLSLRG
jgi:hypothetical protein